MFFENKIFIKNLSSGEIPILLHCSAGVGRTGTVIAIDRVRQAMSQSKLPADFQVRQLVEYLRRQRPKMVQVVSLLFL